MDELKHRGAALQPDSRIHQPYNTRSTILEEKPEQTNKQKTISVKHNNTERQTHIEREERQKGNPYNYKAVKARIIMTDVD